MHRRYVIQGDIDDRLMTDFCRSDRVAWDIETTGLDWSIDKIATCQLHSPMVGTVIAQVGEGRPKNLCRLLEDDAVNKLFHHAPFDLRFMTWQWRIHPTSVLCTKVASRILSPELSTPEHSLKPLLYRYLGVTISKDQRLSDWSKDALSDDQLAYAAGDVEYLLPLHDQLTKELDSNNLGRLYDDCCAFLPARVVLETGPWPDVFSY